MVDSCRGGFAVIPKGFFVIVLRRLAAAMLLAGGVIVCADVQAEISFRAADPRATLCHAPRVVDTFTASSAGRLSSSAVVGTLNTHYGPIHVAIDPRGTSEPYNVTFDFTGTGRFEDPTEVRVIARKHGDYFWGELTPTVVELSRGGHKISVGIMGMVYRSSDSQSVDVMFGAMMETSCAFGSQTLDVDIMDGDQNFYFGDKSAKRGFKVEVGDTLVVHKDNQRYMVLVGQPVQIDGAWYDIVVHEDYSLEAKPVNITVGKLQIDKGDWSAIFVGRRYVCGAKGGTEAVTLPADSYTIVRYDERSGTAMVSCQSDNGPSASVQAGQTAQVSIGTPIAGIPVMFQQGDTVSIRAKMIDSSGMNVTELRLESGLRPEPPVVAVFDSSGHVLHQAALEYG